MTPAERAVARKKPKSTGRRGPQPGIKGLVCLARAKRKELGLSLDEAAAGMGMSKMGLSFLERGVTQRLPGMFAVARFYGVSVVDLWPDLGKKQ